MRVAILTREYPPDVYGGAGVHVDFLARELRRLVDVDVQCMGEPREGATAHSEDEPRLAGANAALKVLSTDLTMTAAVGEADVVHSHTWYAAMAGHWAKLLYDVPHVVTAHSLEPQRPWKAEQLGGGYRISSWAERTAMEGADAVVAVSAGMREDVLAAYPAVPPQQVQLIHNRIEADI
jgi:starch synthase